MYERVKLMLVLLNDSKMILE